jgi:hypothetical protein
MNRRKTDRGAYIREKPDHRQNEKMADSIMRSKTGETRIFESQPSSRQRTRDLAISIKKPEYSEHCMLDESIEYTNHYESDRLSKLDNRRFRKGVRSRRVPNLLAGAPLIPGPITPSFVPSQSPYCVPIPDLDQCAPLAIFPNFMLTPDSIGEENDCTNFMRELVHEALGLPRLLVDSSHIRGYHSEETARNARISSGRNQDRTRAETPRKNPVIQKRFEQKKFKNLFS